MLIIFSVPYLIWRVCNTDNYAPLVVIQIIVGIILGPGLIGGAVPDIYQAVFTPLTLDILNGIAWWGVMLFVMLAGIELDLKDAWKYRQESITTAGFAIAVPFVLGTIAAYFIGFNRSWLGEEASQLQFSFGVGLACTVTALPILVLIMEKLTIMKTSLGQRVLRYASMGDIVIWVLLAVILLDWARLSNQLLMISFFVISVPVIKKLFGLFPQSDRWYLALIWLIVCGLIADWGGLHFMVGAFLAGMVIDKSNFDETDLEKVRSTVLVMLMPVFFMSTGLKTTWDLGSLSVIGLALFLLVVSIVGKMAGVRLAGTLFGWPKSDISLIGWLLQTKALIMIIFTSVLLDKNIISDDMFTALLLMALASTMLTMPMVNRTILPEKAHLVSKPIKSLTQNE